MNSSSVSTALSEHLLPASTSLLQPRMPPGSSLAVRVPDQTCFSAVAGVAGDMKKKTVSNASSAAARRPPRRGVHGLRSVW